MNEEQKLEMLREIFQAFSTLSDVQEMLSWDVPDVDRANDEINHAKRHLLVVAFSDIDSYAKAMMPGYESPACDPNYDPRN